MSRESNQKVNSELFSLEPTALLEFFIIYYDYVNTPDEKLYIHGGTNGIKGSVYWQGVEYVPFPIQSSGFESKGDGSLPRPKLAVSNQDFFVSNLIRRYNNLVGAKIVRKRTFLKFLDNQNFSENLNPYGSADPNAGLEDQVFFILRRSSENRASVEFELASPLEIENVTFPKRTVMARYCSFHYRGNGCRYMGPPVADENDSLLSLPTILNSGGLIRRKYTTTVLSFPTTTEALTQKIASANYSSETIVSQFTPENADLYLYEYLGYFRVNRGEAGTYEFQVSVNDSAEVFIDGSIVCAFYKTVSSSAVGTVSGSILLSEGYHRFLLRYYEANGSDSNQSLALNYKIPLASAFTAVPFTRFFYDPFEKDQLTESERFYSKLSISKSISLDYSSALSSNFKNEWKNQTEYKEGEYVYILNHNIKVSKKDVNKSPNWEPLQKFYYCVKNHTSSPAKNPTINKEFWQLDQCSKTLDGCRIRFFSKGHLPFGGFPGTEEYSISA